MARLEAEVLVNIDLEPTDKAKQFIRGVVIDTLKEIASEGDWLEQYIKRIVDKELTRQVKLALLNSSSQRIR